MSTGRPLKIIDDEVHFYHSPICYHYGACRHPWRTSTTACQEAAWQSIRWPVQVAKKFRASLDNGVEQVTLQPFQAISKQYIMNILGSFCRGLCWVAPRHLVMRVTESSHADDSRKPCMLWPRSMHGSTSRL